MATFSPPKRWQTEMTSIKTLDSHVRCAVVSEAGGHLTDHSRTPHDGFPTTGLLSLRSGQALREHLTGSPVPCVHFCDLRPVLSGVEGTALYAVSHASSGYHVRAYYVAEGDVSLLGLPFSHPVLSEAEGFSRFIITTLACLRRTSCPSPPTWGVAVFG